MAVTVTIDGERYTCRTAWSPEEVQALVDVRARLRTAEENPARVTAEGLDLMLDEESAARLGERLHALPASALDAYLLRAAVVLSQAFPPLSG